MMFGRLRARRRNYGWRFALHWRCEELDSRQLLAAAGVSVVQSNAGLNIVAKSAAARIDIRRLTDTTAVLSSNYRINGKDWAIKIHTNQPVYVKFNGNGGNATISGEIGAPIKFWSLSVTGKTGVNQFTVTDALVTKALSIDTGGGASSKSEEFVKLTRCDVLKLSLKNGRTADPGGFTQYSMAYDNFYITESTIRGDLKLNTSSARNEIYLRTSTVSGNVSIFTGDEAYEGATWTDYVVVERTTINRALNVNTGKGWGRTNLVYANAGTISLTAGSSGRDEMWLYYVSAASLNVDGGAGGGNVLLGNHNVFYGQVGIRNIADDRLVWHR